MCVQLNVFYLLLHIWFTLIYGFLFLLSTWIILCHCVSFVWWCVFSRVSSGLLYFLFLCVGWLCLDCGFVRYQGVVSVNGKGLHGGEESVTTGVVLTAIDPYFFRLSSRCVCKTYVSNCAEASRAHQGG